ncbi:MAG: hypothetical protein ACOX0F_03795 [Syntrophomonadaceae bacterium]
MEELAAELKKAYGEKVQVNYIDTTQTSLSSFPLIARVVQMGYSFPIIAINGQPRMAGGVDINQVKKILDDM